MIMSAVKTIHIRQITCIKYYVHVHAHAMRIGKGALHPIHLDTFTPSSCLRFPVISQSVDQTNERKIQIETEMVRSGGFINTRELQSWSWGPGLRRELSGKPWGNVHHRSRGMEWNGKSAYPCTAARVTSTVQVVTTTPLIPSPSGAAGRWQYPLFLSN